MRFANSSRFLRRRGACVKPRYLTVATAADLEQQGTPRRELLEATFRRMQLLLLKLCLLLGGEARSGWASADSTTHSLSVPYVSAAATNMPRVSPYVSSSNSTETFSDLVRRLLTSQMLPAYQAL